MAGKEELWERWRAGESISDIARALQKAPGSIHGMLEATGGFSPPERRRRRCALTLAESARRSPAGSLQESLCVRSPPGWTDPLPLFGEK